MSCNDIITCRTAAEIDQAYGQVCKVIGVYSIHTFHSRKNTEMAKWPVVTLSDGTRVMLESFWNYEDPFASPDQRDDLIGKEVQAVGMLHSSPPKDEGAQNFAMPCIAPVEELSAYVSAE